MAADIGIVSLLLPEWNLEKFSYHTDRLVLITPADHPLVSREQLSFCDALDYFFVGLHPGSLINLTLAKAAAACGKSLNMRIQVTGYDALCLMVEAELGIGVLPEALARRYAKTINIHITELNESWTRRQLHICARAYDTLPMAAQLLVDHLRTE